MRPAIRRTADSRTAIAVRDGVANTGAGLLFVDKPAGITSHDVVAVVRRAARTKRVGHAGTLDPFATGLVVLAVHGATRLLTYVQGEPKVYEAVIRFGAETNTDDSDGVVTREASPPSLGLLSAQSASLLSAMQSLTGHIDQVPPAFSAKHVNGERSYALARRGEAVELPPVRIHVHTWEWLGADGHDLRVRITCGGGTYIRALARDLGRAMNSAAHCATLRRISSGAAHVRDAVTMRELEPGSIQEGRVQLRAPLPALGDIAHEVLDESAMQHLRHGRAVPATQSGARAALLHDGTIVGIAERSSNGQWQPKVVLLGDVE